MINTIRSTAPETFTASIANSDPGDARLYVTIPETAAPMLWDGTRDHGNADWPEDAAIAAEASRLLGRPVAGVRFVDAGTSLLEGVYDVIEIE